MFKKVAITTILSSLLFSGSLLAKEPVELTQKIYKIEMKNNKEVKYETDKVYPGDTIEYQIVLKNNTEKELKPTVTRSLPTKVELVEGSDSPKADYSLDGEKYLSEIEAEKTEEEEPTTTSIRRGSSQPPVQAQHSAKDYRAIRFTVRLAPKSIGTIIYRVKTKEL